MAAHKRVGSRAHPLFLSDPGLFSVAFSSLIPFDPSAAWRAAKGIHNKMGIFRGSLTFLLGTAVGIYIAQNYDVPNIKQFSNTWLFRAKQIEETYRKPKNGD
ncbi:hypothetical protein Taro_050215 [Colocasia esculenta]|uniref:Uncharacterized protein n=1 Tax=Colocasia esculenta TaxID=4460 RepID=A0A843XCW6_COLES|nr:hypothetical protein [Colocasia esculenta]